MQTLLEVAIGLTLTFAVMAVVVSSVMELISAAARMRARTLEQGIARMLDDQQKEPAGRILGKLGIRKPSTSAPAARAVLSHPLIRSLSSARAQDHAPSYIDAATFTTALLGSTPSTESLLDKSAENGAALQRGIDALPKGEKQPAADKVRAAWKSCKEDGKTFVALLDDPTQEVDEISKVIGQAVDFQLQTLQQQGDPAAAPIAQAWGSAEHDVGAFLQQLQHPPLIARAGSLVGGIDAGLKQITQANAHLGQGLNDLWLTANKDFKAFRREIEDWFDREMARVSGWYSRWTQWIMVVVALVLVSALNISAVTIGRALWLDPTLRDQAAAVAQQLTASTTTTTSTLSSSTTTTPSSAATTTTTPPVTASSPSASCPSGATTSTNQTVGVDTLCEIGLPIGWNSTAWPGLSGYLILHILGILAVAIASSFGAPFWFDALNRLVNLRAGGRPPVPAAAQRSS